MKRPNEDKDPSYVHNFKNQTKKNSVVEVIDYVSCLYDLYNRWWVGITTNVDKEEDVQLKFIHPWGPSRCFQWPHVDDIWLPNDISCKIDIPLTSSGRVYSILEHDRSNRGTVLIC